MTASVTSERGLYPKKLVTDKTGAVSAQASLNAEPRKKNVGAADRHIKRPSPPQRPCVSAFSLRLADPAAAERVHFVAFAEV
ncbi:MAG: hypothetical protein WCU90_05845, partial [Kiritimatiellia bacterium]